MSLRKKFFITIFILIQLGLIWPGYALFSDIYPMILGLPLSFFWVVVMLVSAFFLLLWYYLTDPTHQNPKSSES
ncbi:hypothetical protein [Fodinibius halophilus]|uniref:hypothetical protein n=1 Tax=Fodinibius halophilus TaxID=1736908 RepID=UPI00197AC31B|nr:hypothetical protein [Fodinibius halophilus]